MICQQKYRKRFKIFSVFFGGCNFCFWMDDKFFVVHYNEYYGASLFIIEVNFINGQTERGLGSSGEDALGRLENQKDGLAVD